MIFYLIYLFSFDNYYLFAYLFLYDLILKNLKLKLKFQTMALFKEIIDLKKMYKNI
jgi:hypothetical protein